MSEAKPGPRIATLPQVVADRIAAGEVVERPAAVVKELVENALDSGTRRITIAIEDAGRTLIRVVDDGSGMTDTELALSIGRHSTSKISRFEDLESLYTFGFRGEALPSIAAVSRLEITSKPADAEFGTVLKVSGGTVDRCEPASSPNGTSVSVSHLFYNVPARRKFLRKDATEFKWIMTVFRHFAIAFPEVGWEFFRGREKLYDLQPAEPRERTAGLFGDDVAEDLLEINFVRDWLRVKGFISPPSVAQRNRDDQYLFLNRRPISNSRLNHAVYTAIEPYMVSGGHPLYMIFLEANPDRFDINVHPAKKEVKFADENGAYTGLWSAVRNAVTGSRKPDEPSTQPAGTDDSQKEAVTSAAEEVKVDSPPHLKPYTAIPRHYKSPAGPPLPFPRDIRSDTSREMTAVVTDDHVERAKQIGMRPAEEPVIWQIFNTYIVSPLKTGLVIIGQHIAHERILYEKALESIEKMPWASQQLLFPVTASFPVEDVPIVEELLPLLQAMGFAVDTFGPREFRILAVPAGLRISDERRIFYEIIEDFKGGTSTQTDPRKRLAAAFACKLAIKAGQVLKTEEMQHLIEGLFQTEDPEFCPHGRLIYYVLRRKDIDKWFSR